jgi:hypothetical protein
MFSDSPLPKANAAVRDCVDRCRQSVAPLVTLALFIDELRASPHWRDAEIIQVEIAIRRILRRISDDQPWPADDDG